MSELHRMRGITYCVLLSLPLWALLAVGVWLIVRDDPTPQPAVELICVIPVEEGKACRFYGP